MIIDRPALAGDSVRMKTAEGEQLHEDASNYDKDAYEKPAVTVDVAICTIDGGELKVLLIKRKHPPFRDKWAIPGGFVDIDRRETLDTAARRELEEETGLTDIYVEQLKTYGDPDRDPRMRIITVAYFALAPRERFEAARAGDDAAELDWFGIRRPPAMAFDHDLILNDLLERLIGKISYAPIAFNFLPALFTWSELQTVYETVLGRELLTPNFRRKIKSQYIIEETEDTRPLETAGKRPRLLRYAGERKSFD